MKESLLSPHLDIQCKVVIKWPVGHRTLAIYQCNYHFMSAAVKPNITFNITVFERENARCGVACKLCTHISVTKPVRIPECHGDHHLNDSVQLLIHNDD